MGKFWTFFLTFYWRKTVGRFLSNLQFFLFFFYLCRITVVFLWWFSRNEEVILKFSWKKKSNNDTTIFLVRIRTHTLPKIPLSNSVYKYHSPKQKSTLISLIKLFIKPRLPVPILSSTANGKSRKSKVAETQSRISDLNWKLKIESHSKNWIFIDTPWMFRFRFGI